MAFVGETARIQALITFATSSTEPLSRFFRKSFPMVRAARVPTAAEGKGVNFVVFLRASKYRKKRFHCFRLSSDGQRESLLPQRIQSPPHSAEPQTLSPHQAPARRQAGPCRLFGSGVRFGSIGRPRSLYLSRTSRQPARHARAARVASRPARIGREQPSPVPMTASSGRTARDPRRDTARPVRHRLSRPAPNADAV
jgi:hypothetical protein